LGGLPCSCSVEFRCLWKCVCNYASSVPIIIPNSMSHNPPWEAQSLRWPINPRSYGSRRFITVFTTARHSALFSAR
jgi:hypothetical protein